MVRGRRVRSNLAHLDGKRSLRSRPNLSNKTYKKLVAAAAAAYREEHCIEQYFKEVDLYKTGRYRLKCEPQVLTPIKTTAESKCVKLKTPPTPHKIKLIAEPVSKEEQEIKDDMKRGLKKSTKKSTTDHKITEYFPVRRSERKTKQAVLEEKQNNLKGLLRNRIEDGLRVECFEGKGRGVVAVKPFNRGDFVVEYSGELLDMAQAKKREEYYAQDMNTGCYMYYFKFQDQQYCVDATSESGRLGRLVNHSRNGNLITRVVEVDGLPHLILVAREFIGIGDEISYDYGDRSKDAIKHHPWLAF